MVSFEWDKKKSLENISNHGVSFEEAGTALLDLSALTIEDGTYDGELRYLSLGLSDQVRVLVVVWTFRGENIRIISAWKADKKRREEYASR